MSQRIGGPDSKVGELCDFLGAEPVPLVRRLARGPTNSAG